MRDSFARALYDEACKDDRVVLVVADISPVGAVHNFIKDFPNRYFNVGVAEQNMIGICAGLALKGKRPFAYSIANFSLYRPFEFIRDDLCYQKLPVTVVGMGAGIIYADHGATHHTMEDIAIASAIPNMQVIAPCDPQEVAAATRWCVQHNKGPVYLRLGKSGEPNLPDMTNSLEHWRFPAPSRFLCVGSGELIIFTYGPIAKLAMQVAHEKNATVVTLSTLKPLGIKQLSWFLDRYKHIVVLEEHVPQGGLASQVKQIAWDIQCKNKLTCFTLKDEFIHCNGSYADLLSKHGLSYEQICAQL